MINNNIDDGNEGISYYSVDWTGCPSYLVKHICQEFKIGPVSRYYREQIH
ncbi:hypothetical protein [Escherichia phage AV109]|nr:hypothetical protein [Escherichia phage AV109]WPK35127.1 hypothetical protein [Escherichia phage AV114]